MWMNIQRIIRAPHCANVVWLDLVLDHICLEQLSIYADTSVKQHHEGRRNRYEQKYLVRLTDDERQELISLTKTGKAVAYKIKHAHILLQVDANGPHWADEQVAKAFR